MQCTLKVSLLFKHTATNEGDAQRLARAKEAMQAIDRIQSSSAHQPSATAKVTATRGFDALPTNASHQSRDTQKQSQVHTQNYHP